MRSLAKPHFRICRFQSEQWRSKRYFNSSFAVCTISTEKRFFFVKSVDFFFFNIKYSSTSVGSFDSSFPSISGTFHSGMLVCV